MVLPSNFAVAILSDKLDENGSPFFTTIPHHKVSKNIQNLVEINGGNPIDLIRSGTLFRIPQGRYSGIWRYVTIDRVNPFTLKVARPHEIKFSKTIILAGAIRDGLEILDPSLTGIPR
jgi:hypothetical protein